MNQIFPTAAVLLGMLRPKCGVLAAGAAHVERAQDAHAVALVDTTGDSAHECNSPSCADIEGGAVTTLRSATVAAASFYARSARIRR